jgi:hypothetical protein
LEIVDNKKFVVNEKTGERREMGVNERLVLYTPRQNKRGAPFVCAYQQALKDLSTVSLSGNCWRVFLYLLSEIDFENWARLTQVSVAEALNMAPTNVGKHFKTLLNIGVLEHHFYSGMRFYRIAPLIAWKGSVNALQKLVQKACEIGPEEDVQTPTDS